MSYKITLVRKPVSRVTIRVIDHHTVRVTAPHLMPRLVIDCFVDQKEKRITKQLARRRAAHEFVSIGKNECLLHGKQYRIDYRASL